MKRQLILTRDGSHTLYQAELDEHYHSVHGAIQESEHVFIRNGLEYLQNEQPRIFEVGFGTGLNALLSSLYSIEKNVKLEYATIEKYPLDKTMVKQLNYYDLLGRNSRELFEEIHRIPWGRYFELYESFRLKKIKGDFIQCEITEKFDIIYFDAFAPDKQPELWSKKVFRKVYDMLTIPGVMVTYSAKGSVKRSLKSTGFRVENLQGPPGKREMIRALKE